MANRSDSKREEILVALRMAGRRGLTNADMSKLALRYGGYLGKLYEKGYVIEKTYLGNGIYNYVLVSEPQEENQELPKAVDVLLEWVALHGTVNQDELKNLIEEIGLSVRYKAGTHQKSA